MEAPDSFGSAAAAAQAEVWLRKLRRFMRKVSGGWFLGWAQPICRGKKLGGRKRGFSRVFCKKRCQNVVFRWSICGAVCGECGAFDGGFWELKNGTGFWDLFLRG
jgi:hypothetical protein